MIQYACMSMDQLKATQRRRKQRQERQLVADVVQTALVAKQRETEQIVAAARTQRRKRAPRKHKRNDKDEQRSADDTAGASKALAADASSCSAFNVTIENLVLADELEDSDEYADVVADLEHDLQAFGPVLSLHITQATGAVAVTFGDEASARAAVDAKHNKRFGGRDVTAHLERVATSGAAEPDVRLPSTSPALAASVKLTATEPTEVLKMAQKKKKKRLSKCKSAVLRAREAVQRDNGATDLLSPLSWRLAVRNLLTRDDIADPDEHDDLEDELRSDFGAFGSLAALEIWTSTESGEGKEGGVKTHGDDSQEPVLRDGDVLVEFSDLSSAHAAFAAYNDRIFGNRRVECRWQTPPAESAQSVRVANMLDAAELADDDEFADTFDDVRELLTRFGAVQTLAIDRSSGAITVQFGAADAAARAVAKLDRSVYGGRTIVASLLVSDAKKDDVATPAPTEVAKPVQDPSTVVTERQQAMAPELVDAVTQLLMRLASLQVRPSRFSRMNYSLQSEQETHNGAHVGD